VTIRETTEPQTMTTVDVSRLLKCSIQTVYRLHRDGRLPSVKIGRLRRFRAEDVERLIDEGVGL
jgi:excisionase family DNA binding protein